MFFIFFIINWYKYLSKQFLCDVLDSFINYKLIIFAFNMQDINKFIKTLKESIQEDNLVKIILSNKRNKGADLKAVYIKPVIIKDLAQLNFVFKHNTKDITKNFKFKDAFKKIEELLNSSFYQAILFSLVADYNLIIRKDNSSSLKKSKATITKSPLKKHNKVKDKFIKTVDNIYLKELGVINASGNIIGNKQKKFKQINKYIEIIDNILKPIDFKGDFTVVDMGAGKGYLTFALYDYLKNIAKRKTDIIGVELRKELVEKCNFISEKSSFAKLSFIQGSIKKADIPKIDVLIALHACDTATDDAIYRGINANSKVIICAPCCHKQIRKQIKPSDDLKLVTQFGILKERQAELLTDAIRALLMEAHGYKTRVFEFISTEHTPKNVLIVGVKSKNLDTPDKKILEQITNIKKTYGIEFHYLEKLLMNDLKFMS